MKTLSCSQETATNGPLSPASEESQPPPQPHETPNGLPFNKIWENCTEDNNLTLYGFRRFKTSHLVNLRFLEEEMAELDRKIYQVGLKSASSANRGRDRLGLRFSKRDSDVPEQTEFVTRKMVLTLRSLLKEYDDALASFNKVMSMETFSLIDDERQCSKRTDLHPYEMYHTRLVRVDLGLRSTQDPFHRGIHKTLRALRYWIMSSKRQTDEEQLNTTKRGMSYQNTILIAGALSRFLVALIAGAFMVLPLVMVSYHDTQKTHLITISVWIVVFALLISATLRTSGITTIGVVAAYAAILSVFVSNS